MNRVELTRPDGSKIWIFEVWIQMVRPSLPYEGSGPTTLELSGVHQNVRETVAEVMKLLGGGK